MAYMSLLESRLDVGYHGIRIDCSTLLLSYVLRRQTGQHQHAHITATNTPHHCNPPLRMHARSVGVEAGHVEGTLVVVESSLLRERESKRERGHLGRGRKQTAEREREQERARARESEGTLVVVESRLCLVESQLHLYHPTPQKKSDSRMYTRPLKRKKEKKRK